MQELSDQSRKSMQARHPLPVAAQMRESTVPVGGDQLIGFLECRTAEGPLQETEGNDFGVGKAGRIIIGASPGRLCGMFFEIIVHKNIELGH